MYPMRPNPNQELLYRYLKARQDIFEAVDSLDRLQRSSTTQEYWEKYLKANADIIKAQASVNQLTPQQRQALSLEFSLDAIFLSLLGLR